MRELRNVIERACILADGEFMTERELCVACRRRGTRRQRRARRPRAAAGRTTTADSLVNVERDHIQRALAGGGNKKAAAQMLGLSRRALYRRLERLDLADTISRRREPELAGMSE